MSAPTDPCPYSETTLRTLNVLTSDFYRREAASFSATRHAPWHGWDRALDAISQADPSFLGHSLTLLDLACGNLRFEQFLAKRTGMAPSVFALDNCADLVCSLGTSDSGEAVTADNITFLSCDLVETLIARPSLDALLPPDPCDLAVAFGFMHHLAAPAHRVATLRALAASLRPGGFALVSFWQPLNDPRIAAKAQAATVAGRKAHRLAPFAPNDFLLGWQHAQDVYRFCHHTTDDEIDALLATAARSLAAPGASCDEGGASPAPAIPVREIARFSADGKRGDLNRYVVLQRR